jgi:hypothetical protein
MVKSAEWLMFIVYFDVVHNKDYLLLPSAITLGCVISGLVYVRSMKANEDSNDLFWLIFALLLGFVSLWYWPAVLIERRYYQSIVEQRSYGIVEGSLSPARGTLDDGRSFTVSQITFTESERQITVAYRGYHQLIQTAKEHRVRIYYTPHYWIPERMAILRIEVAPTKDDG